MSDQAGPDLPCLCCGTPHQAAVEACPACSAVAQLVAAVRQLEACWEAGDRAGALAAASEASGWLVTVTDHAGSDVLAPAPLAAGADEDDDLPF